MQKMHTFAVWIQTLHIATYTLQREALRHVLQLRVFLPPPH